MILSTCESYICSHNIAEILLRLQLSTNQSINAFVIAITRMYCIPFKRYWQLNCFSQIIQLCIILQALWTGITIDSFPISSWNLRFFFLLQLCFFQYFKQVSQSRLDDTGGLNFSSLSEDRLSLAVKLAQRDLKKKKEQEQYVSRSPSPKGKTRIIPGKRYWEKQQASTNRSRQQKIKEHDRNRHPKCARTQTPPRMPHSKAFPGLFWFF